jgi:hypothetical protein
MRTCRLTNGRWPWLRGSKAVCSLASSPPSSSSPSKASDQSEGPHPEPAGLSWTKLPNGMASNGLLTRKDDAAAELISDAHSGLRSVAEHASAPAGTGGCLAGVFSRAKPEEIATASGSEAVFLTGKNLLDSSRSITVCFLKLGWMTSRILNGA